MREQIIEGLSNSYSISVDDTRKIINAGSKVRPYYTKTLNGRTIIDKSRITKEELILLDYYKNLVNKYSALKFPNRSFIMTELMNIIPYLNKYKAFTIYKFDFKNFFYNINPQKSFKYLCDIIPLRPQELDFLNKYTKGVGSFIPGIGLHNSLIEIIGQQFDNNVKRMFRNDGLIYYARYVDDCILIFDEFVTKNKIEVQLLKITKLYFGNNLTINKDKTQIFNSNDTNYELEFLGYLFQKGQSRDKSYKYGIAKNKLEKIRENIEKVIIDYKNNDDIDLLCFRLDLFYKRIVYFGDRKNDKIYRWQVRGISDSYKELKRFINDNSDLSKITAETRDIFNSTIKSCFYRNGLNPIPAKVNNYIKNKKFISSFINNKALLLHPKIGLSKEDLKGKVKIISQEHNIDNYSYSELASLVIRYIK